MIAKYRTKLNNDGLAYLVKETEYAYDGGEMTSPSIIAEMMKCLFDIHHETEEYLYLLSFNTKMKLNGVMEISHGAVNSSISNPREIFQKALLCNATYIILVHNHPSGNTDPSNEDILTKDKIKELGKMMSLNLLDFIIIGDDYYSAMEKGEF